MLSHMLFVLSIWHCGNIKYGVMIIGEWQGQMLLWCGRRASDQLMRTCGKHFLTLFNLLSLHTPTHTHWVCNDNGEQWRRSELILSLFRCAELKLIEFKGEGPLTGWPLCLPSWVTLSLNKWKHTGLWLTRSLSAVLLILYLTGQIICGFK